jgi:AcrR family transcriptional regulator
MAPFGPPLSSLRPLQPGRGRGGLSAEEVAEDQRARLATALIELGYEHVTVHELYERAKVSKEAFYRHYSGVADCFTAVFSELSEALIDRVVAAWMDGEQPGQRLALAVGRFAETIAEEPAAARLALCEPTAAGSGAIRERQAVEARVQRLLLAGLEPEGIKPAPVAVQAMLAGLGAIARARLLAGREGELREQAGELGRWACICLAAPPPADHQAPPAAFRPSERLLSKASHAGEPARLRIEAATLAHAAQQGYGALDDRAIRQRADVSCAEFEQHFDSEHAAFIAAIQSVCLDALLYAINAGQSAGKWPMSVAVATRTLLACVGEDEIFARLLLSEMPAAGGGRGGRDRLRLLTGIARMLRKRTPRHARPSPLALEASIVACWEIAHRHSAQAGPHQLAALAPTVAFIALAPAIGVKAARQVVGAQTPRWTLEPPATPRAQPTSSA